MHGGTVRARSASGGAPSSARAARRDPALARTRLIALTGYAQPEDRERARDAGFDAHLSKPPSLDALESLLRDDAP